MYSFKFIPIICLYNFRATIVAVLWLTALFSRFLWHNINQIKFICKHVKSSHQRRSLKKSVLRNFTKFTGKHLCQSLSFKKVEKKETPAKSMDWFLYNNGPHHELRRKVPCSLSGVQLARHVNCPMIYKIKQFHFPDDSLNKSFGSICQTLLISLWSSKQN